MRRLTDVFLQQNQPRADSPLKSGGLLWVRAQCRTLPMSETTEPLQVYVVEDSPIVLRMLGASIEATGAEVSGSSADADSALSNVFATQPDVILIDLHLEHGSGFGLLKTLQEHSLAPDAVKVVLTNYAREDYEELCCRLGADRFFDKTFEAKKCMGLIKSLVEEKRHGLSGRAALEEVGA